MTYDAYSPETATARKRKQIKGRIDRYKMLLRIAPDHESADLWRQFLATDEKQLLNLTSTQS